MFRPGRNLIIFSFTILLLAHLILINDYSINWDYHHVFFEGMHHLRQIWKPEYTRNIPFTPPDPRRMILDPFGPLQTTLPALTYKIFYENLNWLPFDSAYTIPAVVFGSLGVLIFYLFLKEAFGPRIALFGSTFLAFYPRYFGDLHTNVKDIPTAVLYTISIWFFWRLLNYRKLSDLVLATIFFGITWNFKVNAIFIPPIVFFWMVIVTFSPLRNHLKKPLGALHFGLLDRVIPYFVLAPLTAFGIWSFFWDDPWGHFIYLIRHYQWNTVNLEVLYNGNWYCSTVNTPWYYPLGYLISVTPVLVLVCILVGILIGLRMMLNRNPQSLLLFLWFIVPIARYLSRSVGVIDGIRHFEEVIFPMLAVAAIGADAFYTMFTGLIKKLHVKQQLCNIFHFSFSILLLLYLLVPVISYHPYQLSYFNEFVGGLPGAFGRFDIDYWGISQKEAVIWVNNNAPYGAYVYIAMSPDTAGKYLRADLQANLNKRINDDADFVVALNRQTFYYRYLYLWEYLLNHNPAYSVERFGVPLTWVFDNRTNNKIARQTPWWSGEDPCITKYW